MSANNVQRSSAGHVVVPRYVANLNAAAERVGIRVTVDVKPYSNDPKIRLWSTWECTKDQLRLFWMAGRSLEISLMYRHPWLSFPKCVPHHGHHAVAAGPAEVVGESVSWSIDNGPGEFELDQRGEVEVLRHAEGTIWHGRRDDLIREGIDRRWLPLGKRGFKGIYVGETVDRLWTVRRQPDGLFVCRVEGDDQRDRRFQKWTEYRNSLSPERRRELEQRDLESGIPELAFGLKRPLSLRLVVDNTRPEKLS